MRLKLFVKNLTIFLLLVFFLSGCSNQGEEEKVLKGTPKPPNITIEPTSTFYDPSDKYFRSPEIGKRKEIMERYLSEFKMHMSKIEAGDDLEYNLVMASDRYKALISVFRVPLEDANHINNEYTKIKDKLKYSTVYTQYTADGIRFVALMPTWNKESDKFKDALNRIRGEQDEYEYLREIWTSNDGRALYAGLELYAEDIINDRQEIQFDKFYLESEISSITADYFEPVPYHKALANEYGRNINYTNTIKTNTWYTYYFDMVLVGFSPKIFIYRGKGIDMLTR